MFICAHNEHSKNTTVRHLTIYLHTSNDAEDIYTEKHMELIVAQGDTTETVHFTTKQDNYLLSH